uniref:Uncharacterized protein n=1 Tax=Arundo donax TaxID=35708 RepID=A0A0A9D6C7_ARUDO
MPDMEHSLQCRNFEVLYGPAGHLDDLVKAAALT